MILFIQNRYLITFQEMYFNILKSIIIPNIKFFSDVLFRVIFLFLLNMYRYLYDFIYLFLTFLEHKIISKNVFFMIILKF